MLRNAIGFIVLVLAALGCAHAQPAEQLPAYRWAGADAALHHLCARSRAVRTASAECNLTLTRPDGQSVRLDGAIAMRPPSSVHMRAWKFGQRVFDLTLKPDGLWLQGPQDEGRRDQVRPASLSAAKMARGWALLSGEFFCAPDARVRDGGGARFEVERTTDGQRVVCDVERSTLTPRRYRLIDPAGTARFSLTLDRYQDFAGVPWPVRLVATSEGGRIEIELTNVELNDDLAPNAFVPPKKAERIP